MNKINNIKECIQQNIFQMSIRTKETLITLFAMVTPLILFTLLLNVVLTSYSRDVGFHNISASLEALTNSVEEQVNTIYQDSVILLRDNSVRYLIQDPLSSQPNTPYITQKSNATIIIETLSDSDFIDNIRFYVGNKRYYLLDDHYFYRLSSIENAEWFQKVSGTFQKGIWVNTSVSPDSTQSISYITKVVFPSNYQKFQSIIRINYNMRYLQTMLTNSMVSPATFSVIVDSSSQVITYATYSDSAKKFDNLDINNIARNSFQKITLDGMAYWIYIATIQHVDWNIITLIPDNSFSITGIVKAFHPIMISVILCWAIILVISVLNISSMTSRIQAIIIHVRALREDKATAFIPTFRQQDEITELADNVNHLSMELKNNLKRNYLLGVAKKTSDLRALQAQINPHFLYNTLELIDYYAFDAQPEIVEEIVAKLSRFYKLSLNNGRDLYTLREELKLVESYFDIQSIRFQERISIHIDVPGECMQAAIPPITLQPLVENSINHGIREKENKCGNIYIKAYIDGDTIIISMVDDGIGIPEETLQKINTETLKITENSISAGHYGIRNINQRLKIMFGESYGLRICNIENGVKAEVILPL